MTISKFAFSTCLPWLFIGKFCTGSVFGTVERLLVTPSEFTNGLLILSSSTGTVIPTFPEAPSKAEPAVVESEVLIEFKTKRYKN